MSAAKNIVEGTQDRPSALDQISWVLRGANGTLDISDPLSPTVVGLPNGMTPSLGDDVVNVQSSLHGEEFDKDQISEIERTIGFIGGVAAARLGEVPPEVQEVVDFYISMTRGTNG